MTQKRIVIIVALMASLLLGGIVASQNAAPSYVISPGDTMFSIARRYGISYQELAAANNITNPSLIYVGQQLNIPNTVVIDTYTVLPGDTLYSIAASYGTTYHHLANVNAVVNPNLIYVGQQLNIVDDNRDIVANYVVQSGDTLYSISRRYGTDVSTMTQLNGLVNPRFISAGQILIVPVSGSDDGTQVTVTAVYTSTSTPTLEPTAIISSTQTPTNTPEPIYPTETPIATATENADDTITETPTATATATATSSDNSTSTPTPTATATSTPTTTPTPTATATTATDTTTTFTNCGEVNDVTIQECEALLSLYSRANGANWAQNANWLTSDEVCSWFGVTCAGGHVIELDLANNRLNGTIPAELGELEVLEVLYLDVNDLTGTIPAELGSLRRLEALYLGSNSLSGDFPGTFSNLTALYELSVNRTDLSGELPATLTNLDILEFFDYSETELCAPSDSDFEDWIDGLDEIITSNLDCDDDIS